MDIEKTENPFDQFGGDGEVLPPADATTSTATSDRLTKLLNGEVDQPSSAQGNPFDQFDVEPDPNKPATVVDQPADTPLVRQLDSEGVFAGLAKQAEAQKAKDATDGIWDSFSGAAMDAVRSVKDAWSSAPQSIKDTAAVLNPLSNPAVQSYLEANKGSVRGVANVSGSLAGGVAQFAETAGMESVQGAAEKTEKALLDLGQSDLLKARVQAMGDIRKEAWFKDTIDYALSAVGEGVGSSSMFAGATLIGGLPAVLGLGYTSSLGEIRAELIDAGVTDEQQVAKYAYIAAVPHSLLDTMTERGILTNLSQPARKELTKGLVRLVLANGAKEGLTEGVQRVIEIGTVAHAMGGEAPNAAVIAAVFDDLSKGIDSSIAESTVRGALPGGVFGGVEYAGNRSQLAAATERGRALGFAQPVAKPPRAAEIDLDAVAPKAPGNVQEAKVRLPGRSADVAPSAAPARAEAPQIPTSSAPAEQGEIAGQEFPRERPSRTVGTPQEQQAAKDREEAADQEILDDLRQEIETDAPAKERNTQDYDRALRAIDREKAELEAIVAASKRGAGRFELRRIEDERDQIAMARESAARFEANQAELPLAEDVDATVEADLGAISTDVQAYFTDLGIDGVELNDDSVRAIGREIVSGKPVDEAIEEHLASAAGNSPELAGILDEVIRNKDVAKAVEQVIESQDVSDAVDEALADPEVSQALEEVATELVAAVDPYAAFQAVLASDAPSSRWAKKLGISEQELKPLLRQAKKDGLIRVDRRGKVRRTPLAKQASAAPAPLASDAVPALSGRASDTAQAQSQAPSLTIHPDILFDNAVNARQNATGRPLTSLTMTYADKVQAVRDAGKNIKPLLSRIKADRGMRKADVHDLAHVVGYPIGKNATKEDALKSILKRHDDILASRTSTLTTIANAEAAYADSRAVLEAERNLSAAGVPEAVSGDAEGRQPSGAPGASGPGSRRDVVGLEGANDEQPGYAAGDGGEIPGVRGDTDQALGDRQRGADTAPARPLTDEQRAEVAAKVAADAKATEQKIRDRQNLNYKITDDDELGEGGPKTKVRANIEAIRVLRTLEAEDRPPTDAEKKVLVRYTGWGAFAQEMFDEYKDAWKKERDALRSLISPDEYAAARASTRNAHYTSPDVIKGMWSALEYLGFKGGRAIEPGAGVGHFIGMMPENLRADTAWTAVELDKLTGGIAKALYGAADVRIAGYETQKWPDNHFDLAISNVPFDDAGPYDPAYKQKFTLHDYYFIKSLDKVRPGGIVAFITSDGTMDKLNSKARREMASRATFLGAIRLPGGNKGAFAANAGTEVTTDIVFLRKKIEGEPAGDETWLNTAEVKTPEGPATINAYFAQNPDMMLGKMRLTGSMYRKDSKVLIGPTDRLDERIMEAVRSGLPQGAMTSRGTTAREMQPVDTETDGIKEGSFYAKGKDLFRKVSGVGVPVAVPAAKRKVIESFIGIRDIVNEMLSIQSGAKEAAPGRMKALREALNESYDAFVKDHGPINQTVVSTSTRKDGKEITVRRQQILSLIEADPDAQKTAAIEVYDEKKGTAKKAAIFTQDIVSAYVPPEVKGPADAIAVSLNEVGKLDIDLIAARMGLSKDEAIYALGDQIYLNPAGEAWQTSADYLSGDVVAKLEAARAAAELDPQRYSRNVDALEAAQPEKLTRAEITVPFGAPYVPQEVYSDFVKEALGGNVSVAFNEKSGKWSVISGRFSDAGNIAWRTRNRWPQEILEAALNSTTIVITTKDSAGNTIRLTEEEAEARAKVAQIKEMFSGNPDLGIDGWVWADFARAERLEELYNRHMNRIVPQVFDGSHLTFPGLARVVTAPDGSTFTIDLSPHRVNAIWRIIQNGNTLLNHAVGSGKTWTSIMAGMEMKRLGMIQRPMYVVPNHMLNQFSTEFYQAYPNAKLLIATKDQMSAKNRKMFAGRIASDVWDGIIITHSAFSRLGMSPDAYQSFYQEQMDDMVEALREAEKNGERNTVKDLEGKRKRLAEKLKKLADETSKDQGVTFEELGVDQLFVDEAHYFKNLHFATQHSRVKGISNSGESKRATDLFVKIRHLEKSRPGRSAVFMTGTPVSNSMAELYTMQRYLQQPILAQYGIEHFDSWAATFGNIETKSELGSDSRKIVDTTSFSKFVNVPELMTLVGQMMDTQTADTLKLPRPPLRDGKVDVVEAELSELEERTIQNLIEEMELAKKRKPGEGRPFIALFGEGIQLATDMRLLDPNAPFNPNGKIAKAVKNIKAIWDEGNADPAAPNKVQMVFLDMGVPGSKARPAARVGMSEEETADDAIEAIRKDLLADAVGDADPEDVEATVDDDAVEAEALLRGKFNLYQDIKDRLIAEGVPAEQIAFIHDAKNDNQKQKLFDKVKSGDIRVLLGSTAKMGVGTNVQRLLTAMHHLDAPWKPADVEQRDGRILRQGNQNKDVRIFRYITVRSFDAYRWQLLDRKSKFIGQLYAGAQGIRNAEDISPPLPEAAELKAAATGNPLIMEMANLEREVRQLEVAERTHVKVQAQSREQAKKMQAEIDFKQSFIDRSEADVALVTDLKGDAFSVTLETDGRKPRTVTERKEAGQEIKSKIIKEGTNARYGSGTEIDFGTISGFRMKATVNHGLRLEVNAAIEGQSLYSPKDAFIVTDETDPALLLARWVRLVQGVPATVEATRRFVEDRRAQLPKVLEAAEPKPFPKADMLAQRKARLSEVSMALKPRQVETTPAPEAEQPEIKVSEPTAEPTLVEMEQIGRAAFASKEYQDALAAARAVPNTDKVDGYGKMMWSVSREYVIDGKPAVGVAEAVKATIAKARSYVTEGEPGTDRKAVVVLGLPGSGKSTISGGFANLAKASVLNGDDTKDFIPEYKSGLGSMAVHEEASMITKTALDLLMERGENLVLEKTGSSRGSMTGLINNLRSKGYSVQLVLVDVPKPLAMYQVVQRFKRNGRVVPDDYFDTLQTNDVFRILQQEGEADGYTVVERKTTRGDWRFTERDVAFEGIADAIERSSGGIARVVRDGGSEGRSYGGGTGASAVPGSVEESYANQALANLTKTSRTAAGVVDTSASAGKAEKMAAGLTGDQAKTAAISNFDAVIRDLYRRRMALPKTGPEMADFVDQVAMDINKGILKEGALFRTDDSDKFPYTAATDIEAARIQFGEELVKRLADTSADPVETAAWIEWRVNLTDHIYADGVGKTSKALAAIPLMRAGLPLPVYRDNKEFFANGNKIKRDPKQGPQSYIDDNFRSFLAYYRGLMPDIGNAVASYSLAKFATKPVRRDVLSVLPDIAQAIETEISRMLPADHAVAVTDRLFSRDGTEEQNGRFKVGLKLIELALAPEGVINVEKTRSIGLHEVIHALRSAGLFTDVEWRALLDHARKVGIAKTITIIDEDGAEVNAIPIYRKIYTAMYADMGLRGAELEAAVDELIDQEMVAKLAETWATGAKYPSRISQLLKRIARFFEAIRNALNGLGFTTAADVFESVFSGEVAARADPLPEAQSPFSDSLRDALRDMARGGWGVPVPLKMSQTLTLSDLQSLAIRAWHGSPYDFDRFDMSKIGTGEGAQAYGYGLYFAERKAVAKSIRDAVSLRNNPPTFSREELSQIDEATNWLRNGRSGDISPSARQWVEDAASDLKIDGKQSSDADIADHLAGSHDAGKVPGKMYEVNIKANPEDFIDWDKPLSQQKNVEAIKAYAGELWPDIQNAKVQTLYDIADDKAGVSKALFKAGIPGIKYLDGVSRQSADVNDLRGTVSMWERAALKSPNDQYASQMLSDAKAKLAQAESGLSRNYVVFDDSLIEITAKDGVPVSAAEKKQILAQIDGAVAASIAANALDNTLPMDQASRLARAREMGFDTEKLWYHATDAEDIQSFVPSADGTNGPGVYFAPSARRASEHGKNIGAYFVKGQVVGEDDFLRLMRSFRERGSQRAEEDAIEYLKKQGASGIVYNGNAVVWDPRNIRSVNAAFDPSKSDSANILASIAAMVPGQTVNEVAETAEPPRVNAKGFVFKLPHRERWGDPRFNPADRKRAVDRLVEIAEIDAKTAPWADLVAARRDIKEITDQLYFYEPTYNEADVNKFSNDLYSYLTPEYRKESLFGSEPNDNPEDMRDFAVAGSVAINSLVGSKRRGVVDLLRHGFEDEPTTKKKRQPAAPDATMRSGYYFMAGRKLAEIPDGIFDQGGWAVINALRQAGVSAAEIAHFELADRFAAAGKVTREDVAKVIQDRMFDFRRKTMWLNPERSKTDYDYGGTRAFTGPRIPGRGVYFERVMSFPKRLQGGEPFAPGRFVSPHWEEVQKGTWASWRGSVRDVPNWGSVVVGEEGQSDYMQGMFGRGDDWTGKRPKLKSKEYLDAVNSRTKRNSVISRARSLADDVVNPSLLGIGWDEKWNTLKSLVPGEYEEPTSKEQWLDIVNDLKARLSAGYGKHDSLYLDRGLKAADKLIALRNENEQYFEPGSVRKFVKTETSFTPESPIEASYARTMLRDLLLLAVEKKADAIAISTSETTNRIQVNTQQSAAHFYDTQLKPGLERELRRLTGDGSLTLEKIAVPKAMGAPKNEKPYTVWAAKLSPAVKAKIASDGVQMFSIARIGQTWGPKFDILMGEQYRIAEAGGDLSTMYDILTAKLSKAGDIDPGMRDAMQAKVRQLYEEMGVEGRAAAGIEPRVTRQTYTLDGGSRGFDDAEFTPLQLYGMRAQAYQMIASSAVSHFRLVRSIGEGLPSSAAQALAYGADLKRDMNESWRDEMARSRAGGSEDFYYDILNDAGESIGHATGTVVGDTMKFDWLGGTDGGANTLGVGAVRKLREQVRKDFPNVKKFTGVRISGARSGQENAIQSVYIPSLARIGGYRQIGLANNPSQVAGEIERPESGLSDLVADVTKSLGLPVRQGRLDPGLKMAAGRRSNMLAGQFSTQTGVIRLALPLDLATLAHEGGHSLEVRPNMRAAVAAIKTTYAEELTVAPAANSPAPQFPVSGFSGIEIDAETQQILAQAAQADTALRQMASSIGMAKTTRAGALPANTAAYNQAQRVAGQLRSVVVRRIGQARADAAILDLQAANPSDVQAYLAQRFSASGTPQPRTIPAPNPRQLSEGFAEWFRIYITSPSQAQQDAPGVYDEFEDALDAADPGMLEQLHRIQTGIEALQTASPAGAVMSRVQSTVDKGVIGRLREAHTEAMEDAQTGVAISLARGGGRIAGAASGYASNWTERFGDWLYGVYHAVVDSRHPMKRAVRYLLETAQENMGMALADGERITLKVVDNPYKLWRLAEHSKVHATATLQEGVRFAGDIDASGPSYRDALIAAFGGKGRAQWSDENLEQFGSYLVTRRMLAEFDRYDRGELEQIPDRVIDRAVWASARQQLEAANPDFVKGAALLYQFNRNTLRMKLEAGFITPELYAELLARVDYVPLNRIMDDGAPSTLSSARGTNKRRLIYRFQGSTRDFINPLESIVQDVYQTQARSALNKVIGAMDRLARAVGPGGGAISERLPAKDLKGVTVDIREALRSAAVAQNLSPDDRASILDMIDDLFDQNASATIFRATDTNERGEPIVYLWEGGKRTPIRLGDDRIGRDIFEGIAAFGQDQAEPFIDTLALGTQALRAGITKAPAYILTNFLRDQIATWVLSEHFTPFVTGFRGVGSLAKGDKTAKMYAAFAGQMGGVDSNLIDTAAGDRDVLTLRQKGFSAVPAKSLIGQGWQKFMRLTESTEAATRFGHFEAAYKRARQDGMTEEEAAFEAAYAAHDVMDFSRRGAKMSQVARIVAFLNASLQGLDAGRRTLFTDERDSMGNYRTLVTPYLKASLGSPLSIAEKRALPNSTRAWVKLASLGVIGAALAAMYHDDDEYEEFSDQMRATHWFFKLNGVWYRYPKPFELAIVSNAVEAAYARLFKDDERALQQFTSSLQHTMIPPHEVNTLNVYYEWKSGKDLFRDRDIVPVDMAGLPPELQFNAYTSEFSKMVGALTGLSPQRVDHVVGGIFGTWGRDALGISDTVLPRVNQVVGGNIPGVSDEPRGEKSFEDYMVVSRLTRRAARGALSTETFWKQMSASGGAYTSAALAYKDLRWSGKLDAAREARDFLDNLPDDQRAYAYLEGEFTEKEQDLHPLNRARQVISIASGMRKSLILGQLAKAGTEQTQKYKDREPEKIIVAPSTQKVVNEILEDISMREARNALISVGHPGWQNKDIMPVDGLLEELRQASPEIAEEYQARQDSGRNKVYSFEAVSELWPQAKSRLLKDGPDAELTDLRAEAAGWQP